jgi:hypothetical protein
MRKPPIETIETEIRKERAEALGRAGERLEEALRFLRGLRHEDVDRHYPMPPALPPSGPPERREWR